MPHVQSPRPSARRSARRLTRPAALMVAAALALIAWGAFAFGAVYPWAYTPLGVGCAMVGLAGLLTGSRPVWTTNELLVGLGASRRLACCTGAAVVGYSRASVQEHRAVARRYHFAWHSELTLGPASRRELPGSHPSPIAPLEDYFAVPGATRWRLLLLPSAGCSAPVTHRRRTDLSAASPDRVACSPSWASHRRRFLATTFHRHAHLLGSGGRRICSRRRSDRT